MKQEVNLSIKEIETLCLLYNECRLSVQEETELEYILLCTAYSSDIINETKELMGLSRKMKLAMILQHATDVRLYKKLLYGLCQQLQALP